MRLDRVRGFVFDVDGTLVHRAGEEAHVVPGAREVLDKIIASGRPFALFSNGSHLPPAAFARGLRKVGLPVEDHQFITPLCSVQAYLERLRGEPLVLTFASDSARAYLEESGVKLVNGDDPDVVFIAHTDVVDFPEMERAARAVMAGARLLTSSYVAAYAGANGPIISRGAMLTAAISKASSTRPTIVGKPSKAAVREIHKRLGIPTEQIAVIGDDLFMDIPLGHLGGSKTIFVKSGISGKLDMSKLRKRNRPHATVESVAELLDRL